MKAAGIIAILAETNYIINKLKNKINEKIKPEEIIISQGKFQWKWLIQRNALKTLLTSSMLIVALTNVINKKWIITPKECSLLYAYIFTLQSFNSICFDQQYGLATKKIDTQINKMLEGRRIITEEEKKMLSEALTEFLTTISSNLTILLLIEFILLKISNNEAIKYLNLLFLNNNIIFDLLTNNYFTITNKQIKIISAITISLYLLPKEIT